MPTRKKRPASTSRARRARRARSDGRMRPATPRQAEILTFVRDYMHKHGYSPTYEEIAAEFGITKVTVFEHLTTLEERGLLHRDKHKARSLQLSDDLELPDERPGCLQLRGRIAAGAAIEAVENRQTLELDTLFAGRSKTFALEVQGESMLADQIAPGDYVIVEQRATANNGDMVVALLDNNEATLKRFYRERNRIRLQPSNPSYPPIYVQNVTVQGVVIGVVRRL